MCKIKEIRDKKTIKKMLVELKKVSNRNYMLFYLGINTGLRVGDLVKLKVKDIINKDTLTLVTEKDKALVNIPIKHIKDNLNSYIDKETLNRNEYLFRSRQVDQDGIRRNISGTQAYRIIMDAAKKIGIDDYVGTHTMRKTFAYHYYNQTKNLKELKQILGHETEGMTLEYLNITQEDIDKSFIGFAI